MPGYSEQYLYLQCLRFSFNIIVLHYRREVMKETCFVQLMLSEPPLWLLREESCERPWVCLC